MNPPVAARSDPQSAGAVAHVAPARVEGKRRRRKERKKEEEEHLCGLSPRFGILLPFGQA